MTPTVYIERRYNTIAERDENTSEDTFTKSSSWLVAPRPVYKKTKVSTVWTIPPLAVETQSLLSKLNLFSEAIPGHNGIRIRGSAEKSDPSKLQTTQNISVSLDHSSVSPISNLTTRLDLQMKTTERTATNLRRPASQSFKKLSKHPRNRIIFTHSRPIPIFRSAITIFSYFLLGIVNFFCKIQTFFVFVRTSLI